MHGTIQPSVFFFNNDRQSTTIYRQSVNIESRSNNVMENICILTNTNLLSEGVSP